MHIPLFAQDPLEMGMDEALILERISAFPVYVDMFDEAFPEDTSPISTDNTIYAIAAFTRTIIAGNSKYDRWLMGEEELTETEEHGRQLFFSDRLQCGFCHGGIFFDQPVPEHTGVTQRHGYFNTGLYDIDDQGGYPITAQGMIETTGIASDMGKFRVPTLRNLAYTYPWMHDGSEISLYNIIANYARGGRLISSGLNSGDGRDNPYKSDLISGFDITDIEIEQVLSFLKTLEDPLLQTNINLLSPFCIEQEGENIYEPCEPPFTID
jgi:cytochrome c peroxidase